MPQVFDLEDADWSFLQATEWNAASFAKELNSFQTKAKAQSQRSQQAGHAEVGPKTAPVNDRFPAVKLTPFQPVNAPAVVMEYLKCLLEPPFVMQKE